MGVQIHAYPLQAMAADFQPELDEEGFPDNIRLDRAYTSSRNPEAMDGIEGGHDDDPLNHGLLGSRWYLTGDRLGAIHAGNSLPAYADTLRRQTWRRPDIDPSAPEARNEPFWDLIYFITPHLDGGMLGQQAVKRLHVSYLLHPTLSDPAWVNLQAFHDEWAELIDLVANYEEAACLQFG